MHFCVYFTESISLKIIEYTVRICLIDYEKQLKALHKVSQFVSNTEETEKKNFVHKQVLCNDSNVY